MDLSAQIVGFTNSSGYSAEEIVSALKFCVEHFSPKAVGAPLRSTTYLQYVSGSDHLMAVAVEFQSAILRIATESDIRAAVGNPVLDEEATLKLLAQRGRGWK